MNLRCLLLSERSQTHKVIHYMKIKIKFSGGKNNTQEMDSVWLKGTLNEIEPGNRDRPGVQSCTLCSQKSHRLELYELLTKFLPRMPPMDNPGNDQPPGTCTQVIKVTQAPFKFPRCGFYLYKHHCSFHLVEHSLVLWLGLCLQSCSPHFVTQKFYKLTTVWIHLCNVPEKAKL